MQIACIVTPVYAKINLSKERSFENLSTIIQYLYFGTQDPR